MMSKEVLIAECKRIEENSQWNAASHFAASTWAGYIHTIGGSIPIILGTIGGWHFLSDKTIATQSNLFISGLLTLISGIVGSLLAFWNLAKIKIEHFTAATNYKTLENESRRAYQIHANDDDYASFKRRVLDLAKKYDELGEKSAPSYDITFWLARKKIESGIYETAIDKNKKK